MIFINFRFCLSHSSHSSLSNMASELSSTKRQQIMLENGLDGDEIVMISSMKFAIQQMDQAAGMFMNFAKSTLPSPSPSPTRIEGYVDRVVPQYSVLEFRQHFRMIPNTFEVLLGLIVASGVVPERHHTVKSKILMFLWLLGNKESFRGVADRFGVSKGTLHLFLCQIADGLVRLREQFIAFPRTERGRRAVARRFRFPNTIGCVDGTYIPMLGKSGEKRDAYICRKGFPALHLQVVSDSALNILDAVTGYPGSVHDARVYRNCPLYSVLKDLPPKYHLLGDSAYPLESWMVTKYKDHGSLTRRQKAFNVFHGSERACVERCIGLLKGKFRRLKQFDAQDVRLMAKSIVGCIVLHNLILKEEGVVEDDIRLDEIEGSLFVENVTPAGASSTKRDDICSELHRLGMI